MKYKFCGNCSALNRVETSKLDSKSLENSESSATCGKCGLPLGELKKADTLNESQTEKLIRNSDNLVVVDVFADWCGPCQSYGPIFSKVGELNFARADFVKLNADHAPNFSSKYGIRGVPATFFFKNGRLVGEHRGLLNESQLTQELNSHM